MKRIIIICEGQTEREFCRDVLSSYFSKKEILIDNSLIKKTGGGITSWRALKNQIETHLKQDRSAYVTTLLDYYGILKEHGFPDWDIHKSEPDKLKKIDILETAMLNNLDEGINHRFFPYLQLHEFEGLLFNDIDIFKVQVPEDELINIDALEKIIKEFPNPELINDNPETTPSRRLSQLILGYNKVIYGSIILESIGIERIRAKCPRFNNWIQTLENIKTI